ncbi:MAG: DUF1318 domain-containing protein [Gammaproteobacteria bacterium]|nr:DUF1318 domain-containing protein [Gammaproteobacteria bacterium]
MKQWNSGRTQPVPLLAVTAPVSMSQPGTGGTVSSREPWSPGRRLVRRLGGTSMALALMVLVGACVTINVYFPAPEAKAAADRFIERVWGAEPGVAAPAAGQGAETAPDAAPKQPEKRSALPPEGFDHAAPLAGLDGAPSGTMLQRVLDAALALMVADAHAQAGRFSARSAPVQRIEASMAARHAQLEPYYDAGVIGLDEQALVAVRNMNAVPLAQRAALNALIDADNRDRQALYRAVAEENGHPEWEAEIRAVWTDRWLASARQRGWYLRRGGSWVRQ